MNERALRRDGKQEKAKRSVMSENHHGHGHGHRRATATAAGAAAAAASVHQQQQQQQQQQKENKKRTNLRDLLSRSQSAVGAPSSSRPSSRDETDSFRRSNSLNRILKPARPIKRLKVEDMMLTPVRQYEEHSTEYKLPLPVSDTPMIRRNQQMRRENEQRYSSSGNRRASLDNRGKRASSIGNGLITVPHETVPAEEFHKHLDASLPDPQKMRQILTWCSKRELEEEKKKHRNKNKLPTEELNALNIAKVIKEELVRDLSEGKIDISWWNRDAGEDGAKQQEAKDTSELAKKALLPNERNVKNRQTLQELEERLAHLQKTYSEWEIQLNKKHPSAFDPGNVTVAGVSKTDSKEHSMFDSVVKESTLANIQGIEKSLFQEITGKFQITLDEFNQMIHFLKSFSSLRSELCQLQSKKLLAILDSSFSDDSVVERILANGKTQSINVDQLLKGISRVDG